MSERKTIVTPRGEQDDSRLYSVPRSPLCACGRRKNIGLGGNMVCQPCLTKAFWDKYGGKQP